MSNPRFWVLWKVPAAIGAADRALSFLPPAEEDRFARQGSAEMESGRRVAEELRPCAFETFLTICARLPLTTDGAGRTLRAALRRSGECSDWWFHIASSRVVGLTDPSTFEALLTGLAIDRWADASGARTLHLHGAPRAVVAVLRSKYVVVATETWPSFRLRSLYWPVAALRERGSWLAWTWQAVRRAPRPGDIGSDGPLVALTGHPWLRWNAPTGAFADALFKDLPSTLQARGLRVIRFLWYLGVNYGVDDLRVADAAYRRGEAVTLQAFIDRRDVVREMLSFRALRVYLRWSRHATFRRVFRVGALDVYPLFRGPLLGGFIGSQIPLARLGALATERACNALRPAATICHFEWIADARPHFEGVRRSRHATLATAMQHSTNTSVLLYHLDPRLEFRGEPDGCPVPHAAHVFVMGRAGLEQFRRAGFEPGQLSPTGSRRFDVAALREAVRVRRQSCPSRPLGAPLRVLVLPSSLERDGDMIEAAYAAAAGMRGVDVGVRTKPAGFSARRPSTAGIPIRFSGGSLADDLAESDLVLFTASGAAEEALACGIPTWQWLPVSLEGATIAEVARLPRFYSVAGLRDALTAFAGNPAAFAPAPQEVARAIDQLFGRADGLEAERIAERLCTLVPRTVPPPSVVADRHPVHAGVSCEGVAR